MDQLGDRISIRAVLISVVVVMCCVASLVAATFLIGSWYGEVDQTFREVKLVNQQLSNVATIINDARGNLQVMDHRVLILQQRIDDLEKRIEVMEKLYGRRR